MVRVFLSHSSRDQAVVTSLLDLIQAAVHLPSTDIRCTTIDGYRLPAGANTAEHLRVELLEVPVLVGLISEASFDSAYVLFELGARWGSGKRLMPLLAPGVPPSLMRGPLSSLNALSCSAPAQLHQFLKELADVLGVPREAPEAYQRHLDALLLFSAASPPRAAAHEDDAPASSPETTRLGPPDIPTEVFQQIRAEAQRRYPTDYEMQEFREEEQLHAYRRLQTPRKGPTA